MDVTSADEVSALLLAATSGDLEKVEKLLDAGVPAYAQEEAEGVSALMLAAGAGHGEVVSALLIAGAPWNAIDRRGRCAGNHALDAGHQHIVDALVDAAVRAELLLGAAERGTKKASDAAAESKEYLSRSIRYEGDTLFDSNDDGVMMAWETPLMKAHAEQICATCGDVMNVGFGMGIIDGFIQELAPRSHTIIEAHPGVLSRMKEDGWMEKPGVRVCAGRWQDALATLVAEGVLFDGIFFDTYGEYDSDMADFHRALPQLLKPGGVYSFFNGMCPFNVFFQGVACSVVQLELQALGLTTTFQPVDVETPDAGDQAWAGVRRQYFCADTYFLPHCVLGAGDEGGGGGTAGDEFLDVAASADGPVAQLLQLNRSAISFLARSIATADASLQETMRDHVLVHFESAGWALLEPLAQLWAHANSEVGTREEPPPPPGALPATFVDSALTSRRAFEASLRLPDGERARVERGAASAAATWRVGAAAAAPLDANSAELVLEIVRVANLLATGGEGAEAWVGGDNDELRLALLANPLAEEKGDDATEGGTAGGGDVVGKDSQARTYGSAEEVWSANPAAGWYDTSRSYWSGVRPDVGGMLGGLGKMHDRDVGGSLAFIDALRADGQLADGTALDCGAGIGRVAAGVLLPRFAAVELLEPDGRFLDVARRELPSDRVAALHEAPLQSFSPAAGTRYAAVWAQWVLIYLTDDDLVAFLSRCAAALVADGGRIVIKESVSKAGKGFYVDQSDGSITRTEAHFQQIFDAAGLRVVRREMQEGLPKQIFQVVMWALAPAS